MSNFSYPAPFEFSDGSKKEPSTPKKSQPERSLASPRNVKKPVGSASPSPRASRDGVRRSSSNERAPPTRSKSAEDTFSLTIPNFNTTTPARRMGPKTKSGRHLPKAVGPSRTKASGRPNPRARSPPKKRGIGMSKSSNLESMGAATRTRSSSLSRQPTKPASPETSPDPKKPGSLKDFLMSPLRSTPRKSKSGNLEELRASLHSAPDVGNRPKKEKAGRRRAADAEDVDDSPEKRSSLTQILASPMRKPRSLKLDSDSEEEESSHSRTRSHRRRTVEASPDTRKPSSLTSFLTSPLRKAPGRSRSSELQNMVPSLDLDSDDDNDRGRSTHSRSVRSAHSRTHTHGSGEKKTKTFQQLLGKKDPTRRSAEFGTAKNRKGRGYDVPASPARQTVIPDREPSLSPEDTQKPKSMINNFLDNLYDSYVKADDDDGDQDDDLHNSVSRLDMSLTRFF